LTASVRREGSHRQNFGLPLNILRFAVLDW
jgi:hypothetical protein